MLSYTTVKLKTVRSHFFYYRVTKKVNVKIFDTQNYRKVLVIVFRKVL